MSEKIGDKLPKYAKIGETEASQDLLGGMVKDIISNDAAMQTMLGKGTASAGKKIAKYWPMIKKAYEEKERQSLLDEAMNLMDKYWIRDEKGNKIPADDVWFENDSKYLNKMSDEDDDRFFKVLNKLADKYDTILG